MLSTAAAANTGRQREPSQSRSGNSKVAGATSAQGPESSARENPLNTVMLRTANEPSISSRNDGGSRTTAPSPTKSGATVMMPRASEANHARQIASHDA